METKKYFYYVVAEKFVSSGNRAISSGEIFLNKPITTLEQLVVIGDYLTKELKDTHGKPFVTFYQLLRIET